MKTIPNNKTSRYTEEEIRKSWEDCYNENKRRDLVDRGPWFEQLIEQLNKNRKHKKAPRVT